MTTPTTKPWLTEFILLAAIWGASFLFMRLGASEFGAIVTAFLRTAIAAAVMLPWLLWRGLGPQLRQAAPRLLLLGVVNSAIPFACFAYAVLHITTGLAGILNAAAPLFGAALGWLWLKDKPNVNRSVGLLLGFGGVVLLAMDRADFKPGGSGWAVVACLAATLCYGVAANYTKRYLQGVNPIVSATGTQLGASLALALPAALWWPAQMPGLQAWGAMLALALVCTAWAYALYFKIMAAAGPTRALAVTFVIPLFALFYGAVFLGEAVTAWMVGCGAVVIAGTAMAAGLVRFRRF